MKRAIAVMMMLLCVVSASFAQGGGKPKIGVYMTGGGDLPEYRQLSSLMQSAFNEREWRGVISVYERSGADIQEVVDRELEKQKDGSVDRKNYVICQAGKQAPVQYVCVGEILSSSLGVTLSVRILDVNTARVVGPEVVEIDGEPTLTEMKKTMKDALAQIRTPFVRMLEGK